MKFFSRLLFSLSLKSAAWIENHSLFSHFSGNFVFMRFTSFFKYTPTKLPIKKQNYTATPLRLVVNAAKQFEFLDM